MKIVSPIRVTDGMLLSSNVPENEYAAYGGNVVFMVGQYVIDLPSHKVYQCLAGGSGYALSDATKWLCIGYDNRWRMHDTSVQSRTAYPLQIVNEYRIPGRCNTLALLNIKAAAVRIQMIDDTAGTVYDKTFGMVSTRGINNAYAYCFEPIVRATDLIRTDLPNYANTRIIVTVTDGAGNAEVGCLLFGSYKNVGDTQWGVKLGMTDFSTKEVDAMGDYRIVPRAYRKTNDVSVIVAKEYVDQLYNLLVGLRITPTLYIAGEGYTSTYIYGFFKEFSIAIAYPRFSLCNVTIEGLT